MTPTRARVECLLNIMRVGETLGAQLREEIEAQALRALAEIVAGLPDEDRLGVVHRIAIEDVLQRHRDIARRDPGAAMARLGLEVPARLRSCAPTTEGAPAVGRLTRVRD